MKKIMLIERNYNGKKLFTAVEYGDAEEVRAVLSGLNVDVNFVAKGPELKSTFLEERSTPLIVAARNGHNEIVQILLDSGAEIDKGDSCARTPLWYTANIGHNKVVKTLLDAGADPNKTDHLKRTPLWWTTTRDNENVAETVEILINGGTNLNKADINGETPLHSAICSKRSTNEVIELLIRGGTDPNTTAKNGGTPLHCAIINGRHEAVKILLQGRADPGREDGKGNTPLQLAKKYNKNTDIIHELLGARDKKYLI